MADHYANTSADTTYHSRSSGRMKPDLGLSMGGSEEHMIRLCSLCTGYADCAHALRKCQIQTWACA
eukprot:1157409-Pelagomonas_calceolata.AAC.14